MTTHHVRDSTAIHFTIDGRHDALLRHNIYPLQHMMQRKDTLLEALFRISEGFFFGPHHLIMAASLYFEEKESQLERRRICREIFTLDKWTSMITYDAKLRAPVGLEHLDIPHPEHLEEPQPVEIPVDMRAPAPTVPSTGPMPEVAPSAPPAKPGSLPVYHLH
ncbi:hypothetical protein CK203_094561 [Vitis vinifera]|uniref:Uncharacterized protein n=1 Tax=Vitis vinifera TaxID=29760 RepID=A0A438CJL9_VITVI|nr:hypothetical protein CK203_094561 [Vitis vinifera]